MAKKFEFLEVFMGIVLLSFVSANAAVISDVKVCNLRGGRAATITWLTDVAATGEDSVLVTNTSISAGYCVHCVQNRFQHSRRGYKWFNSQ